MRLNTIAILLLLIILVGCTTAGSDAKRDIANGHLEVRVLGSPRPSDSAFVSLMRDRYGVQIKMLGCIVDDQLRRDTDAYNIVMTAEIENRFGTGILERIESEAQRVPAAKPAA